MKKGNVLVFLIIWCSSLSAQHKSEPRVVVLYPYQISLSDEHKRDLKEYEREIEITEEIRKNYIKEDLSDNWKAIRTHELEFLSKQDFFGLIAYTLGTNLIYRLHDFHDYPLVFPVKEVSSGDMESLRKTAQKYDVDWVINFLNLEFSDSGEKKLTAKIQLYNVISHRIFFNIEYTGNSENPGGSLECEAGSWDCASNNVVKAAIEDIFDRLEKNRKYWRQ